MDNTKFAEKYLILFRTEYNRIAIAYSSRTGEHHPVTFEQWMDEQIKFEEARQDAERIFEEHRERLQHYDRLRSEEKERADRLENQAKQLINEVEHLQKMLDDSDWDEDRLQDEIRSLENQVDRLLKWQNDQMNFLHRLGVYDTRMETIGDFDRIIEQIVAKYG